MVKPLEKVDHIEQSKANYLSQYIGLPNFTALLDSLMTGMEDLEDLFDTWGEKLNLDTATGVNLDYWGELLDADRFLSDIKRPANDDIYRSMLYAIAGAYTSDGSCQAVANVILNILRADGVFIDDNEDGSFSFEVDNPKYLFGKDFIKALIDLSKPVGVEFIGYTVTNVYGEPTFGFAEDEDQNILGFAVLANIDVASGYWENYHCAATGEIGTTQRIVTELNQDDLSADFTIIQPKSYTELISESAGPVPYTPYVNNQLTCRITNSPSQPLSAFRMTVKPSGDKVALSFEANEQAGNWDVFGLPYFGNTVQRWSGVVEATDNVGVVWRFSTTSQDDTKIGRYQTEVQVEATKVEKDGVELANLSDAVVQFAEVLGVGVIPATYSSDGSYYNYWLNNDDLTFYGFCYDAVVNGNPFATEIFDGPGFSSLEVGDTFTLPILNAITQVYVSMYYSMGPSSSTPTMSYNALNDGSGNFIWKQYKLQSNTDSYADFLTPNILYRSRNTVNVMGVGSGYLEFLYIDAVNTGNSQEVTCSGLRLCNSSGDTVYEFADGYELSGFETFFYPTTFFDMTTPLISGDALFTVKEFTGNAVNCVYFKVEDTATIDGVEYPVTALTTNEARETLLLTSDSTSFDLNPIIITEDRDGIDFVDDIMNEFNGVIGSKIGYEFEYQESVPVPDPETVVGNSKELDFGGSLQSNSTLGPRDWDVRINATSTYSINNASEGAPWSGVPTDVLDAPGQPDAITLMLDFGNGEPQSKAWYNSAVSSFASGDYLTYVTKNDTRLDFKVNTNPSNFIVESQKWVEGKADNHLFTLFGIPFDIPFPAAFDDLSYQTPINMFANGNDNDYVNPSIFAVCTFYFQAVYKNPDGSIHDNWQAIEDAVNEMNVRQGSFFYYGHDGTLIQFRRNTSSWNNSFKNPFTIQPAQTDASGYQLRAIQFDNIVNDADSSDGFPKKRLYDIYMDGSYVSDYTQMYLDSKPVWANGFFNDNYNTMYSAFATLHTQNFPVDTTTTGFANSRGVGFRTGVYNYSYVLHDDQTNTTNAECWINGLKMSTRSAMDRIITEDHNYEKNEEGLFDSKNPNGNFNKIDKPKPLDYRAGYTNIPFVLCLNTLFVSDNDRLTVDNGVLKFVMDELDSFEFVAKMQSLFGDGVTSGKNITLKDRNNIEWSITSTETCDGILNISTTSNGTVYRRSASHVTVTLDITSFDITKEGQSSDIDSINTEFQDWVHSGASSDDTANGSLYVDWLATNGDQGFYSQQPFLKTQWLMENLSTFDIVEVTDDSGSDYWKLKINMSSLGTDNVVLFNNNQAQIIMELSADQLSELNISEPNIVPFLIKETSEADGEIPEVGYSLKGGGRLSLNQ